MKRISGGEALILSVLGAFLLALSACASSGPLVIPEGMSSEEIVQKAQEEADNYRYANAVSYYQAVLDRYGDQSSLVCMAKYEIAFLYYKEGKYAESDKLFTELLAMYNGEGGSQLPPSYKILADKIEPKVLAALKKQK